MVSRKEYELKLLLDAETNGTFTRTLSKAQQEILSLQKDIQSLSRLQGDINGYQKQQQAVESTNKKLAVLQQQYENIQREINETGESSSDLQNKLLAKQQQIDRTSQALKNQTQKLEQMGTALQEAGVDTGNLTKESARLEAEMGVLKQRQEDAADSAESFGTKSVQAFNAVSEAIAAAGIAVALHEIYEAYSQCIGAAADFEESMSNVEALSGASAAELAQLSDMAKELGATTKFTAKESADAMGYMAMAGWDAQQMISGMPGVLRLAAAAGEDLAIVSDIVTDSMTAFGLSAADTSRYADVLAATATNSNTSVSVMGETFKQSASLAGALGYSVEDVSVAIGLMANAGIKGSNAGTALKNIFSNLIDTFALTGAAIGDVTYSAVNADGTMKSFAETMDDLRGYFSQMTAAEKLHNAETLVGQRAMAGFVDIMNASESDFAKLTANINNCAGAAERMDAIKMDNMNGQLTLLDSAWEAVQTTIGEQFTPALQDLYAIGAEVLGGVNDFLKAHPEVIKAVTAAAIGFGTMTAGVVGYSTAVKVAIPLMKMFTASMSGVGLILGAGTALVSLTAAMAMARKEFSNTNYVAQQQRAELDRLNGEYEKTCAIYGETSDEANRLRYQIMSLTEEYEANTRGVKDLMEAHGDLMNTVDESAQAHQDVLDNIKGEGLDARALASELTRLAGSYTGASGEAEVMSGIIAQLNDQYDGLNLTLDQVVSGTYDWGDALDDFIRRSARAKEQAEALARAQELVIEHSGLEQFEKELQEQIKAAEAEVERLRELNASAMRGHNGTTVYSMDYGKAKSDLAPLQSKLSQTREQIAANEAEYAKMVETINGADLSEAEKDQQMLSNAASEVGNRVEQLVKDYNEAYDAALKSVGGQYEIWDEAKEAVATSAASINKALESQADYWSKYNDNLQSLSARTGEIEGLSDVIASFADGSKESVNAIAGMAAASDEDLKKMVANWQRVQEEQKAASGSIAGLKINITQIMDELQQALAEDVENMDMSAEAAAAGEKTIQAFIDAAKGDDVLRQVKEAYDKLGLAAARSLATSAGTSATLSTNTQETITIEGQAAEGTESAKRGYYLVGEEGPEIVWMNGGEAVMNATATQKMFSEARTPDEAVFGGAYWHGGGDGVIVSFAPVYHISGNMQPDELEAVLRDHDADLREQIEDVIEELLVEQKRSAF